jgi:uncharacterized membrane protein
MSLTPLLHAAPEIQVHAFAAMSAFALGVVQLAAPKGTLPHRTLGWIWVALMLVISASSFAVVAARRHRVRAHKVTMMSIFAGALLLAGLFTLVPGRIMHTVLFDP